jgi:hypothetical protein
VAFAFVHHELGFDPERPQGVPEFVGSGDQLYS